MLIQHTSVRGFSIIAVTGALIIISLLTVTALQLAQDHLRRAVLSADYAVALQAAESALAAGECDLAVATRTPIRRNCPATVDAARVAALDPITLAGFVPGLCGQGTEAGLCWPLQGQSASKLADLIENGSRSVTVTTTKQRDGRSATPARYVIEPIPDALPGQWIQAGAERPPSLFRITAAGFGTNPQINVLLQTVFRPRANEP
ncbi:MAG: pilus assembly protein PilZ [Pseudomonadota bacterium]|uniref:pilus assembly PilX family protein n=1 Tax=Ralstonia pickettii TaxID=329 RepID=UPI00271477D2|nr:pilus assembly protein PilZ [Ralstonia pickettii]MEE2978938.1 pilus assembly protein PilZ [Pseudomonadota bacterium]WKZ85993.1 pilus assembly protein PilZ [Ralstonia pickettii]